MGLSVIDIMVALYTSTNTHQYGVPIHYVQTNVKPSIGNDGKFCVCVKPHDSYEGDTYAVTEADFEAYETLYNDVCFILFSH